ncbi:MAG: lactate racemase domain-containing protein [Negativicutes bacterium]
MGIITELLQNVELPRMVRVRQNFPASAVVDVAEAVRAELRKPAIANRMHAGMKIAVAVGSRGVAEIPLIVRMVVEQIKAAGADPFIVPGMGSHGGATAQGQIELLAGLGVTETSAGCPVVSSMEVVELGVLPNGLPVFMDKNAMQADGIVVINRIKSHTAFSGPIESGLVKMITIGLGKQKGADSCHAYGFGHMAKNIVDMARIKLQKAPFLFGVGTIENAYDQVAKVVAIPAEEILDAESRLLLEAKRNMPGILFTPLDVLIVDQMGKEYSGAGMDSNITGRAATPYVSLCQQTSKMAVLDLTAQSHGNAVAVGLADITTRRLFNKINFEHTYANALTSTVTLGGMIPLIMDSDRLAIQAAVKTCNVMDMKKIRMVRIPNTLHVKEIDIAESLFEEAQRHPQIEIIGEPRKMVFDVEGNMADIGVWR